MSLGFCLYHCLREANLILLGLMLLVPLRVSCSWLCGAEGRVQAGGSLRCLEYLGLDCRRGHMVEGDWLVLELAPTDIL